MNKTLKYGFIILLYAIPLTFFGQISEKVNSHLLFQYNKTVCDRTLGNNPWSFGIGLQSIIKNSKKIKPLIDITSDFYLDDDKVLRLDINDKPIGTIDAVFNLLVGPVYQPTKNFQVSFQAGPSFINGDILFGIKPSLGIYITKDQKWVTKFSYTNIFNRSADEDFGTINLALGRKLF